MSGIIRWMAIEQRVIFSRTTATHRITIVTDVDIGAIITVIGGIVGMGGNGDITRTTSNAVSVIDIWTI